MASTLLFHIKHFINYYLLTSLEVKKSKCYGRMMYHSFSLSFRYIGMIFHYSTISPIKESCFSNSIYTRPIDTLLRMWYPLLHIHTIPHLISKTSFQLLNSFHIAECQLVIERTLCETFPEKCARVRLVVQKVVPDSKSYVT